MSTYNRKPEWLRITLGASREANENFLKLKRLVRSERLTTVCEEARCPNIHECWGQHRTATFMILGEVCTRRCRFCSVKTGLPGRVDLDEPKRVADSVVRLQLHHVVITMVNRDELPDGGATVMAATVDAIHGAAPDCSVEVLSSDLMGDYRSIAILCKSMPEITSHNIETVRRLTPLVRSRSDYQRSLKFLEQAAALLPQTTIKSSMMLGLGETGEEVEEAMDDLLTHKATVLNLGQYLQPTRTHLAVQKYWHPDEFAALRERALAKGFTHCEAGPLVRSSYHAKQQYESYRRTIHPLYQKELV